MKFLGNMMFERGLTSFWWQSWSYCPSTDGQVRATEPSLAWCSIAWDQASRGAGGGGGGVGEAKKRNGKGQKNWRMKRADWRGALFTLPNLPLWLASLSDFSAQFHSVFPLFPFSPSEEPGPRLGRRCQYSSSFISNLMIIASPPWHKQDIQFPY